MGVVEDLRAIRSRIESIPEALGPELADHELAAYQRAVVRVVKHAALPVPRWTVDESCDLVWSWQSLTQRMAEVDGSLPRDAEISHAAHEHPEGGKTYLLSPEAGHVWKRHAIAHVDGLIRLAERTRTRSPADQAYGAAREFLLHLEELSGAARWFLQSSDPPDACPDVSMTFAMAFVAWFDLSKLLTPDVCTQARRVYSAEAPSIRLGLAKPMPTVIQAIAEELGTSFRNAVYTNRRHPLEPDLQRIATEAQALATARQVAEGKPAEPLGWGQDFESLLRAETTSKIAERLGLKCLGDVWMLMAREWKALDGKATKSALWLLRCSSINFDELRVTLTREAEAVLKDENAANMLTIASSRSNSMTAIQALPTVPPRPSSQGGAMLKSLMLCVEFWRNFGGGDWVHLPIDDGLCATEFLSTDLQARVAVVKTPDHARYIDEQIKRYLDQIKAWDKTHPIQTKRLSATTVRYSRKGHRCHTTIESSDAGNTYTGSGKGPTPRGMHEATTGLVALLTEWARVIGTPSELQDYGLSEPIVRRPQVERTTDGMKHLEGALKERTQCNASALAQWNGLNDEQRLSAIDRAFPSVLDLLHAVAERDDGDFDPAGAELQVVSSVAGVPLGSVHEWAIGLVQNVPVHEPFAGAERLMALDHAPTRGAMLRALLRDFNRMGPEPWRCSWLFENADCRVARSSAMKDGPSSAVFSLPTMRDLIDAIDPVISDDTFRRIRDAAGIEVKLKGAAARNRRYTPSEVDGLIVTVLAGSYIERTAAAEAWARWGTQKAASKPQVSRTPASKPQVGRGG